MGVMDYRREVDGLRAIAVIPVIFFHADFQAFRGGFVGVDVFFVISGYLITTIILAEIERGTFSLVNFYERRTRRLLPALFLVMLVCLPFAWIWLLPSEIRGFSQSLIAVSTFSSNILFWKTSDYWEIAGAFIPLLHTWSLAVEEQYYLLFPLFMMVMWRFGKRWILSLFIMTAATSFLLAQWGSHNHPTATFYLLITRIWEIAIGASIALYFFYRKNPVRAVLPHKYIDEALGIIGLLMIGYAVFWFDETVPFPGLYALVPTIGTALIILFSSSTTVIGRLLGIRILVGIGLISYSAYLWHQPLFAFARYRSLRSPDASLFLILAALSIVLAFLSWRFVEKPFRTRGIIGRRAIFSFAAIGSVFFISIGFAGHSSDGWPGRIDGKLLSMISGAKSQHPGKQACLVSGNGGNGIEEPCVLVRSDNASAYLMGDSHAAAISAEMKRAFERENVGLIEGSERGCPPVENVYVYVEDKYRCFNHNKSVYRFLENRPDIKYIIVVARWALYIEATRFDNGEGGIEQEQRLNIKVASDRHFGYRAGETHRTPLGQVYADSLEKLVSLGRKVILVYPIPEAGWDVPRYVRNYHLQNPDYAFELSTGSTSHEIFQDRNRNAYEALDSVGQHPNLFRVYPEKIFCNNDLENRCIVQGDGRLLYRDDDHLSDAGAMLVTQAILGHLQNSSSVNASDALIGHSH